MDAEALRKFYFSHGTDYKAYKKAQETRQPRSSDGSGIAGGASDVGRLGPGPMASKGSAPSHHNPTDDASSISVSAVNISVASTSGGSPPAAAAAAVTPIATVGISSLKTLSESSAAGRKKAKGGAPGHASSSSAMPTTAPVAASAEYLQFLKRQQELNYRHATLTETYQSMQNTRVDHQRSLVNMRREALELLRTIEESTDWQLKSRYDVQQLIRDCGLALQPVELVEDTPGNTDGVAQLAAQLTKIRDAAQGTEQIKAHSSFLDQALRRLQALGKALETGNMDATELGRIPETLAIQLEAVVRLPTVDNLIEGFETNISKQAFKIEDARVQRDSAVEDGEVHVAEKLCYDIIDAHEVMLNDVLTKHDVLEKAAKENDVIETVRAGYETKAHEELQRIRVRAEKLHGRCEEDMKKMFALREKVEEVEAQTAKKVQADREASDLVLQENHRKLELVFSKINELEKEVEVLERERHREIQKRVVEKDKDEHRRAEFTQFCDVVEAHLKPLERTIRNMDLIVHSVDVVEELTAAGFESLRTDLSERAALLRDIKLESQKQHVEIFRGLLLELGDVVHRKERMIEETEKSVQQAHIQQEILAETFNPNAKKFGDVKKRLLASRDELEQDVTELKERAAVALKNFEATDDALQQAGVTFVHPVTQQQHRILEQRARMIEVKAAAIGYVEGQPATQEIAEIRQQLMQSRLEIEETNAVTSGTINKALPMIRAANKARHK